VNKKDGYRQRNVRQRQKSWGLEICSRSILPYAKLIFGRPLHASFLRLHERQQIIITKWGYLPTYLHKCCQKIVRIFGLLIYSPAVCCHISHWSYMYQTTGIWNGKFRPRTSPKPFNWFWRNLKLRTTSRRPPGMQDHISLCQRAWPGRTPSLPL